MSWHLFTYSEYRELLRLAQSRYRFVFYDRAGEVNNAEPIVYWRHDIDASVKRAEVLARIEAETGAFSTYFVHLHSKFYHFWERDTLATLCAIAEMGHQIGLHFDCHFYGGLVANRLGELVQSEAQLLSTVVGQPVSAFSFHDPTDEILQNRDSRIGGLVNAYSEYFLQQVDYVSDSAGIWQFHTLYEVLEKQKYRRLQVVTHPVWWTREPLSPKDKVLTVITEQAVDLERYYLSHARTVVENAPRDV